MSAPTQVWDIHPALSGLPREKRSARLLMVMEAYIDDSGSGDQPVFVLAGFIARAEQWATFSDQWQEALKEPPSIAFFKMQEAFTKNGQFARFTDLKRDCKLAKLAKLCLDHLFVGISTSVGHDDYAAAFKNKVGPRLDVPYFMMVHSSMLASVKWQERVGIVEPIKMIFDEQMHESDFVKSSFDEIIKRGDAVILERIVGRPIYKNDKDTMPLQAADMLAWHVRRHYFDKSKGQPMTVTAALPFLTQMDHESDHWDADRAISMFRAIDSHATDQHLVFQYPWERALVRMDQILSYANVKGYRSASSGETVGLLSFPAKQVKRYRLVDRCHNVGSPHLHKRSEDECLS